MIRFEMFSNVNLTAAGHTIEAGVRRVVNNTAAALLTQIRVNASTGYHRRGLPHIAGTGPGPNVATGDYRRSWNIRTGTSLAGAPEALVSTNAPQAARLELGFVGADSLGRVFNQPPYPHVRPAVEQLRPGFIADVQAVVDQQTRRA